MTQYRWLYLRLVALALGSATVVAVLGWLGDRLNVGPGTVPIWDPDGRAYWMTGLAIVMVVAAVYQRFDRDLDLTEGRRPASGSGGEIPVRWILPATTVLSIVLFLGVYRGMTAISAGALLVFSGLLAGTASRHLMLQPDEQMRERARLVYTLVVHGVTFMAMAMIYINKVRSLFSATAVMIVAILLFIALTEGEDELFNRRLAYALVGGVMLGQVTWGLNYWQAAGWTGGAVLLIFFYLFGGLVLTHLRRGVNVRDVAEYGGVSIVAFGIVVYSLFA
jgi:lysylphosphatidylglycerol synthetase-like protein (DUF2156 family)